MRSLRKDLWRSIVHSFGRFLAIFLISGLGVGFLSGLQAASPDMKDTADAYYNEYNLMDIRVQSTLGLTDDDVDALGDLDFVEAVAPARTLDLLVESESGENAVHVMELPGEDGVNGLKLTSGRMPESPNECLVDPGKLGSINPQIGETLIISESNDEDSLDSITQRELTVVGTALTPEYVSFERGTTTVGNGSISYYIYVPEGVLDMDYYTMIDLTVQGGRDYSSFSEEYKDLIQSYIDEIELLAPEREQARYDQIVGDAQAELDNAQAELDDARADADQQLADAQQKIDDAKAELADGEKEIADGEKEIADGWKEYDQNKADFDKKIQDAKAQLDSAQAEIDQNRAALEEQASTIESGEAELNAQAEELDQAKAQAEELSAQIEQLIAAGQSGQAAALQTQLDALNEQITSGSAQLDAAREELNAGKAQLEAGRAELDSAQTQLDENRAALEQQESDGLRQLNDAKQQLQDAEAELEEGKQELEDGRAELADAEQEFEEKSAEADEEINDAQQKLDDAQAEINDISRAEWYVMDRNGLAGYSSFANDTDRIDNIAKVFPVFFFLVAALVCLTTMTRMVEEERTQIGTLKALGYSNAAVTAKYLIYALSATVLGSIFGLLLGFNILPSVVWAAYGIMYNMPPLLLSFRWGTALLATFIAVAVNLFAALSTCYREMRAQPAELMRPKAPKAGKRILLERIEPLWKHMGFTRKVTARNIFRYKKRFFMTVVGIAGCTALLLTGFGLKNSISGIVPLQFNELFLYDSMVVLPDDADDDVRSGVFNTLDSAAESYAECSYETVDLNGPEGSVSDATMIAPKNPDGFTDFIVLRTRLEHEPVPLTDGGILLSEKTATTLGVSIGDEVTINNGDRFVHASVSGIVENYVMHYVYLTPGTYESLYGKEPDYSAVFALLNDTSEEAEEVLSEQVLNDGALAVSFTSGIKDSFQDTMNSLDYVVIVLILAASLLCFIVLYNLTNINITERKREIATIKVLGFRDHEVSAYVYRENVVLTLVGIAFGLVFGIGLHAFVMAAAEVDMVMFPREISALCYVLSAVMTLVFSMLVNLIMYRKLQTVDMVESLKAVE